MDAEGEKFRVIVCRQALKQLGFMGGRFDVGSVWVVGSGGVA